VRQAVSSALQRAADWGIEHLAITPFGLGVGNLDIEEAAEVLGNAIRQHRQAARCPTTITIIVETDFEQTVVERFVNGMAS
jgi:O-acetyl-ADP-ribose deacetylase (regulator of RNase III)